MGKKGFTRAELSVVVAVIVILVVMLMPACSTVRLATRTASCQDNMRAIGLGFTMYKQRWQELGTTGYPHVYGPTNQDGYMLSVEYSMGCLYPEFVKSPSVYDCPGDPGDAAVAQRTPTGWYMEGCDYAFDDWCTVVAISADGTRTFTWDAYRLHREAFSDAWPLLAGVAGELCVQNLDVECYKAPPFPPDAFRPLKKDSNHAGGANLLFGDAHVEWLPMQDTPMYGAPYHAFESAIGFVPNPYIVGDNCVYEAEVDGTGDTYIRYYNGRRWPRRPDGKNDCWPGYKIDKCFLPAGWYDCP